jgi:hypothetical protein
MQNIRSSTTGPREREPKGNDPFRRRSMAPTKGVVVGKVAEAVNRLLVVRRQNDYVVDA